MSRPRLLYVSVNDGTDTRILKEVVTLARRTEVTFVGVRQEDNGPNQLPNKVKQVIVVGRRRSIKTLLELARVVYRLGPQNFDSVHVVNENLLITLYPLFLAARNVVLDVFDSMFLKSSPIARFLSWPLQWMAHCLADQVLVTDKNRYLLVPDLFRANLDILPNYPSSLKVPPKRRSPKSNETLRIFFSGSLSNNRGVPFLEALLNASPLVEVLAAGWIYDEPARKLCERDRVRYLGVVTPAEAAAAARECDYILCLYKPDVLNNINASPNKIYDAALVGVPVIINSEVVASSFVSQNGLGVVVPSYQLNAPLEMIDFLIRMRGEKTFPETTNYVWENVDSILLRSHLL